MRIYFIEMGVFLDGSNVPYIHLRLVIFRRLNRWSYKVH